MPKLDVTWADEGTCSLTGKEDVAGFVVTFEDGTTSESFLSAKGLIQLLTMKTPRRPKSNVATPTNGEVVDAP